jgi:hypothetical protein
MTMGQDMVMSVCEDVFDLKRGREVMDIRLENIPDGLLSEITENHFYYEEEDIVEDKINSLSEGDLFDLDDLTKKAMIEYARERIREAIETVFFGDAYVRDITHCTLKGTRWLFSGGPSWGDDPTESYSLLNIIDDSGVSVGLGVSDFDYDNFSFKA